MALVGEPGGCGDPGDGRSSSLQLTAGAQFYQQVAGEVSGLPGVESVGLASFVPIGSGATIGGSFYVESRPRPEGSVPPVRCTRPSARNA